MIEQVSADRIHFSNGSLSANKISAPSWQMEIINRVEEEFTEDAIKVSEQFRSEIKGLMSTIKEGYFGIATDSVIRRLPRYCYIKNVDDGNGNKYDTKIDLLLHLVTFHKIDK